MTFDPIAPHYRWIEAVCAGPLLQRCRTAFIREIRPVGRVLTIGEGNGRFLAALLRQHPAADIVCVDASAAMLRLAGERLRAERLDTGRVEFIHADIEDWVPARGEFDLIVTHFFLDCFRREQLGPIIARLAAAAAPGASWLVSDFREPESGLSKWRARLVIGLLYSFFRLTARLPVRRLTPPDDLLAHHGFELRERHTWNWGLLHSDLWKSI